MELMSPALTPNGWPYPLMIALADSVSRTRYTHNAMIGGFRYAGKVKADNRNPCIVNWRTILICDQECMVDWVIVFGLVAVVQFEGTTPCWRDKPEHWRQNQQGFIDWKESQSPAINGIFWVLLSVVWWSCWGLNCPGLALFLLFRSWKPEKPIANWGNLARLFTRYLTL